MEYKGILNNILMVNYNNGLIYKLCCKDINIKDIYIGSTCNFTRRKCQHKTVCYNPNNKAYNSKVYKFIRCNGGWDNWDMILIEKVNCNDKLELNKIERQHIEQNINNLNSYIPSRTDKEYFIDNKDKIKEYQKTDKHKEYKKEYYLLNKEYQKEYYLLNRDKILEQTKKYKIKKKLEKEKKLEI